MNSTKDELGIRAVVFKEGDIWIAQALELDICARSKDLQKVKARLATLIELEREHSRANGKRAFTGIEPAPKYFHDMWERQTGFTQVQDDLKLAMCA